jgi:hypothetical protein
MTGVEVSQCEGLTLHQMGKTLRRQPLRPALPAQLRTIFNERACDATPYR